MKLRVVDRLLAGLAGVMLICLAICPLVDAVFDTGIVARLTQQGTLTVCLTALLALVGAGALYVAFRRVKHKGFVVQSTDAGELSISVRALEDLVDKCVEKHEELHVSSTVLESARDGLIISLRVGLAAGVNIPLAVNALQKQIKQYVVACSGVDVHEVKVQVETTTTKAKPSIYAVSDILENPPALPREEEIAPEAPEDVKPVEPKEEKCLHQRLFSEEEQPVTVPEPPVKAEAAEPEEAIEAEEAEAPAEPEAPEELTEEEAEEPTEAEELPEMPEEAEEYPVDEESIADLAALDGTEEIPEEPDEEEETEA